MPGPRALRLAAALVLATALGAPATARAAESENPAQPAFNIVRFEPIIVTLFDNNRATGLMSVTLALQVPTPEDKAAIEERRMKYVDAFNAALVQMGRLYVTPRKPINMDRLTGTLETTASRLHGKGKVRALILDASTRPLG